MNEQTRTHLAIGSGVAVGIAAVHGVMTLETRSLWHRNHAQHAFEASLGAIALGVAAGLIAWVLATGGGRPRRATRAIAFSLAYGGLVAIALVARYDAPSLQFARAALARGDLGAAEEAAQVVINEDPSRASAARTLLDDARERRMTAANDIATAVTQLSLPWANANRRQALAQQWLARIDRDTRAAIEGRDSTKLSQIASATRSFDATRSTYASNAGTLIAQSRSTPGEAPCAATLPSDGPFAALRTEYLARVRARAEEVIASVRANQGSPERWNLVVGLTRCLEQMGQSASMTSAALEQAHRAETAREEARLAAARAAAIRAMNNSSDDDSGGSYGGGYGGSTYVNGYYRRGRYVRGYYRRRR